MTVFPSLHEVKKVLAITYRVDDYPPRTIWIDEDKLTDENLKNAIKEDLKKYRIGLKIKEQMERAVK